MKLDKSNIRYEFYSFETGPTGNFSTTLVLNKPASIQFILCGTGNVNDFCVINNLFNLSPIGTLIAPRELPFELILNNNLNEIDNTNYTIRIQSPLNSVQLKIVCKYLIQ
jgi:hypothetical protein